MLTAMLVGITIAITQWGPQPCPVWLRVVIGLGIAYLAVTLLAEWWEWIAHKDRRVRGAVDELEPQCRPTSEADVRGYARGLLLMGMFFCAIRLAVIVALMRYAAS